VALADIAHFRLGTRPIRTVEFKNIVAPEDRAPKSTILAEIQIVEIPSTVKLATLPPDVKALRALPDAKVLSAPKLVIFSGQEASLVVGEGEGEPGGELAPTPKGIKARLLPTLNGNTVHYVIKLTLSKKVDDEHSITWEFSTNGDVVLGKTKIFEINKGEKSNPMLGCITFHRGDDMTAPADRKAAPQSKAQPPPNEF